MSRRILIIAIAAVVLIALGVGAVLLVDRTPSLQNALTPAGNTNEAVSNTNSAPAANTNTNPERAAIEYVARNFSELYGSGTTQNDFINILEAKQWGTANFNSYLDRLVAQERAKGLNPEFVRTISTALVITITKQAATTAAVTVTVQRAASGGAEEKLYHQNILLDLMKQSGTWKINAATWRAVE